LSEITPVQANNPELFLWALVTPTPMMVKPSTLNY
jgi:uncharacterized protein (DUF2236 family)